MWRCLPALVFIACLLYYDATHTLTKPFRLALYAFCLMLVLLCIRALGRYAQASHPAPARVVQPAAALNTWSQVAPVPPFGIDAPCTSFRCPRPIEVTP
jgi:hypothetical protein